MKIIRAYAFVIAAACVSFASANEVQNYSFETFRDGHTFGSFDHWTRVQTQDGFPVSGMITSTNNHHQVGDWSASFQEIRDSSHDYDQSVTQLFATPLATVTEAYFYGLSFDQDIYAKLLYTDGTVGKFSKHFTSTSPDNWIKFDLLSDVDASKNLKGITIGMQAGPFDLHNGAFIDDVVVNGQPVPEPTTMIALASGVGMLLRRRKQS